MMVYTEVIPIMSTNFLTQSRHRSTYYFRRRIPTDLKHHFKNDLIVKSLNTTSKKSAVILARNLASQTDNLFRQIWSRVYSRAGA